MDLLSVKHWMLDVNTVYESTLKDQSKILQTSTSQCYFGHVMRTDVIAVHISRHYGFVLSTVDSVIIRLFLSLVFILASSRD